MPALPDPQTKALLNVREAADVLEVNERTVYKFIDEGRFPIVRVGRSIRIRTDEFLAAFGLDQSSSAA